MDKKTRKPRQSEEIRDFILRNADAHPTDITQVTVARWGISRATANNYLKRLTSEGLLSAEGQTKARRYSLAVLSSNYATIPLVKGETSEDAVFRSQIQPYMKDLPDNLVQIIAHGFTEIFNNAIDHSESPTALISYIQTYAAVQIIISDAGVGIFQKIQKDCGLDDARTAILELSKGKLTTDPKHHSGEGIFFTSKMFNLFNILSGNLGYQSKREDDWGWLIETDDLFEFQHGTVVRMTISTDATWTTKEVFDKFEDGSAGEGEYRPFSKTHVPIKLGRYGNEQLISRSQAKRLLTRFERFAEICLDFEGVQEIGQAFADEIFRVFAGQHPNIQLSLLHASSAIRRMIDRVRTNAPDDAASQKNFSFDRKSAS